MNANELRIGNYIERHNKVTGVKDVVQVGGGTPLLAFEWMTTLKFNPIPLTEEWLLKFGFEFRNNNKQYGWFLKVSKNRVLAWCHSKEIGLEFDTEDYDYNNTLFDFHCQYVHQLQNLYFALTGEELTLK